MTDETLLHRQINPNWVHNNKVSSQAFIPFPKDEHQLSVYDGDLISAEASWAHFVGGGYQSVGVLAVSVSECDAECLKTCSSPEVFEEHAHIDFTGITKAQCRSKGKKLLVAAEARGWQHRPET
jgi:hypothetical protein